MQRTAAGAMTLIEINPHRWGWKVLEALGVEPVFKEKDHAVDYAQSRACFRSGRFRCWIPPASLNARLRSTKPIESCDSER
jgi:hypothetical protein